jgi:HAD superfamily hydrolase (TIGR01509 family)
LTAEGERQAAALRARLDGQAFDSVWSSDLDRALSTARLAWGEPRADARLREMSFGELEGRSWEALSPEQQGALVRFSGFDTPGGESFEALRSRVLSLVDSLAPGRHLLFTHGGVVRLLSREVGEDSFVPTGTLLVVDWTARRLLSRTDGAGEASQGLPRPAPRAAAPPAAALPRDRRAGEELVTGAAPGGVLWDLDGTLVDSAGHHWVAWRDTLAAERRAVEPADFANSFGKRNDEILRELFGHGIAAEWIERVSGAKERAYRQRLEEHGLEALPGAFEWLGRLHEAGWKQALASSAPRPNIDAAFRALHLERFLDAVVSADEVGRGKPDPAVFLEAARRLGVAPGRCVVVEDAPAGLEAARRAGMAAIGVLSSHHTALAADVVVPSLDAIRPGTFEALVAGR